VVTDAQLEALRHAGEELRAAFAEERRAISKLDRAALEAVAERKVVLARELATLRDSIKTEDPLVRDLFIAIRTEAHATALLAAAATQAVRSMLGYEPATGYDRRAQTTTSRLGRVLATY
jgi:hypothetical protein